MRNGGRFSVEQWWNVPVEQWNDSFAGLRSRAKIFVEMRDDEVQCGFDDGPGSRRRLEGGGGKKGRTQRREVLERGADE